MGSTTTYGAGNWGVSLPRGYLDDLSSKNHNLAGYGLDLSPTVRYTMGPSTGGRIRCETGNVSPTVPMTWAEGDLMMFNGSYFYI